MTVCAVVCRAVRWGRGWAWAKAWVKVKAWGNPIRRDSRIQLRQQLKTLRRTHLRHRLKTADIGLTSFLFFIVNMIKLSGVRGCGITLPRTPDVLYDVMCDRHVMNRQRITT